MDISNMTPSQCHYANVGYLMLHNAMPTTKDLLVKLGYGQLATIPGPDPAPVALPFGQAGNGMTQAAPSFQAAGSIMDQIEALIGEIASRGGRKQFRLAQMFKNGQVPWPTVDCFGRAFPSAQEILTMPKSKAQRHFTNSGWPKTTVGSSTFYLSAEAGESYQGKPIAAGEWRMWNGRPGTEARYIKAEEFAQYLTGTGMNAADVAKLLQEQGVQILKPQGTEAPAGAAGRPKRQARQTSGRK